MQNQKPRLSNAAIPAGIFLLFAAIAYGLCQVLHPMLFDRQLYIIAGLLAVIAIMLFTRSRNMAYGVLFAILTALSGFGAWVWYMVGPELPYFFAYITRGVCFLGMMIICFRRGRQPKKGPWFLALVPLVIIIGFLVLTIIDKGDWRDTIWSMSVYLLVTEVLLFIGLLLAAVAFRNPQQDAASSNPLPGTAAEGQTGQTVYTGYAQAEGHGSMGQPQNGYSREGASSAPATSAPASTTSAQAAPEPPAAESASPAPAAPESAAAEPASVESAQVEWLDEEE